MDKPEESLIIDSWCANVKPWINAVREQTIESRRLVTDQAIIDVVERLDPDSVLDIGCGEGWLMRALEKPGRSVSGLDCAPEFLTTVRSLQGKSDESPPGSLYNLTYEEIDERSVTERFQLIVCNFSLIGKESVENVFKVTPKLLEPNGALVVQTLNPLASSGDSDYKDGWREGSWEGIGPGFETAPPWYFRTMETWQELFLTNGFGLKLIEEPVNPKTGLPASLLMVGQI